jgi:predicted amidohydrolase YtcJ
MWAIWAAKAMGEERSKASISIEPGKFADMAALSDDIFAIPPSPHDDQLVRADPR